MIDQYLLLDRFNSKVLALFKDLSSLQSAVTNVVEDSDAKKVDVLLEQAEQFDSTLQLMKNSLNTLIKEMDKNFPKENEEIDVSETSSGFRLD